MTAGLRQFVTAREFAYRSGEADQLLFDQYEQSWLSDPDLVAQAQNNTIDNFRLAFDHQFMGTVVGRMGENEAIFKRVLDDEEFRQVPMDFSATRVFQKARATGTGGDSNT